MSENKHSHTMPLLFLGHGLPMNAIGENQFTKGWRKIAETIPKPKASLNTAVNGLSGQIVCNRNNPIMINLKSSQSK